MYAHLDRLLGAVGRGGAERDDAELDGGALAAEVEELVLQHDGAHAPQVLVRPEDHVLRHLTREDQGKHVRWLKRQKFDTNNVLLQAFRVVSSHAFLNSRYASFNFPRNVRNKMIRAVSLYS